MVRRKENKRDLNQNSTPLLRDKDSEIHVRAENNNSATGGVSIIRTIPTNLTTSKKVLNSQDHYVQHENVKTKLAFNKSD